MTWVPAVHLPSKRYAGKTRCGYYVRLRGLRDPLPVSPDLDAVTCGKCKRLGNGL